MVGCSSSLISKKGAVLLTPCFIPSPAARPPSKEDEHKRGKEKQGVRLEEKLLLTIEIKNKIKIC